MAITDHPVKNLALPFLAVCAALWLRPILQKLPAPELPKLQLKSLNGTNVQASNLCQLINHQTDLLKFCEDIVYWEEAKLAIVSCDGGRPNWNTVMGPLKNPEPRGQLLAYHMGESGLNTKQGQQDRVVALELTSFPKGKNFHPLGVELHEFDQHSARLFVVNHRQDRSVVEIFKLELNRSDLSEAFPLPAKLSLKWERSLAHDLISTPNSIAPLGPNSFLLTNDHYFNRRAHPVLHVIETWLSLRGGNVLEVRFADQTVQEAGDVDAAEWKGIETWKVIDGIPFANGLTLNPSRSTLVVSCTLNHKLWYYHQLAPTGANKRMTFTPVGSRSLSFAPDNLRFVSPERLIVAGHPHELTLLKFSQNVETAKPAGSSVAVVVHHDQDDLKILNPHKTQVHEIFKDDGSFFASSCSAIIVSQPEPPYQDFNGPDQSTNKLVVTGLYQTGLLECDLP